MKPFPTGVLVANLFFASLFCCQPLLLPAASGQSIRFRDATADSGIDFVHEDGADEQGYLVSIMASGLGLIDYDRDGRIDVYFLSGKELTGGGGRPPASNALYRNLAAAPREATPFTSVGLPSRSDLSSFSLGVAVADYDNDGFADMALSNFGSVTLLRNNGDGTFSDWSHLTGLADADVAFGAGVAFLDADGDGQLDLYVADYVDFSFERFEKLAPTLYPYPPGPDHFAHRADHLFFNSGDGRLVDRSREAGIADFPSPSMGVICGDFDQDDDTDIFVCSDARPNLYFVNDGQGHFSQDAELAAVAYNASGIPVGSMGVEAGDVDRDGWEDLFITDYSAQMPILFRNLGEFGFEDVSAISRSGRDAIPHANWGAGLFDFDHDGDRDLFLANGHLLKNASSIEQLTDFRVRNFVLANQGDGRFVNVTDEGGSGLQIVESSRGLAFDDLDNDGDIDCVVLNADAPASYLENELEAGSNWVQLELCGVRVNRDALGARVIVECGQLRQVAEMRSGRGYQSSYGCRLHFGLGTFDRIDRVTVDWGTTVEVFTDLEVNRIHRLQETQP